MTGDYDFADDVYYYASTTATVSDFQLNVLVQGRAALGRTGVPCLLRNNDSVGPLLHRRKSLRTDIADNEVLEFPNHQHPGPGITTCDTPTQELGNFPPTGGGSPLVAPEESPGGIDSVLECDEFFTNTGTPTFVEPNEFFEGFGFPYQNNVCFSFDTGPVEVATAGARPEIPVNDTRV